MSVALVKTTDDLNDQVTRFLSEEMVRVERFQIERIELVYAPRDFRAETLKTWTRAETPDLFVMAYVPNIVAEALEKCEQFADNAGPGKYRFVMRTIDAQNHRATTSIVVEPSQEGHGGDALSGPLEASPTGVLGQQMRNNEFLTRMLKEMMQGTIGQLNRQLMDSQEREARLAIENADLRRDINANKNAEAQRELEIVAAGRSADRLDLVVGKALQLAPVIATGLLGDKRLGGVAANGSALGSIISTLGGSLLQDPKRVQEIMGKLTLQEQVLFREAIRIAHVGAASATPSGDAATSNAGNQPSAASPQSGTPQPAPPSVGATEKG